MRVQGTERDTGDRRKSGQRRDLVLYATPEGARTVHSAVRAKILTLLGSGDLPFDEIVRLCGRAKSTVSAHLKVLLEDGIIGSKTDPSDERKKIFYLASPPVGNLSASLSAVITEPARTISFESDPFGFYRYMFRTIRVSLLSEGINIDPVLRESGRMVGGALAPEITDTDLTTLLSRLKTFWEKNNLGRLEVESSTPLVLRVYDCFECGDLPDLGRPACAFDSGVLEAVFSRHFAREFRAEETACYAMGDDHCRFVIAPV